jgi:D-beta-D-heptose 7-phosphate kinase/D-beta-D-heptose 1-phosphate adenosyltransferase
MLSHAARGTILCVGDLMLDRFVTGRVERISPEAPIPVLAIESESTMPGGAGNVVANIRSLGGRAHIVAVVGTDSEGLFLQDLLGPADLSFVIDPARPTSVKTRFIAGGQQLFRADMELSRPISPKIEEQVVDEIQKRLRTASLLVLSDYGKGVLTERVITRAIAGAKAQGIPVIADPKGADYSRYRGATAITPNLQDLSDAVGGIGPGNAKLEEAARGVLAKSGIGSMYVMVATRGAEGVSAIRMDAAAVHVRDRLRDVVDISGAGDTAVAALALAITAGVDLAGCAALAKLAAAVVIGKAGTATLSPDELRSAAQTAVL